MKKILNDIIRIGLPLILAASILWWMYRDMNWDAIVMAMEEDMDWTWMLLSMPFGILAQVFRALRWKLALKPLGENPRTRVCCDSIFLSYASSLAIPRIGEVLRCGVLKKYENINFGKLVGSVVTERVVDMAMILLLSLITMLVQIPMFLRFFKETGVTMSGFLGRFTATGYWVTGTCVLLILLLACFLTMRLKVFSKTKSVLKDLVDGALSVRKVESPTLFILYSAGIWASYYLHFYLTFFCFDFTADLGPMVALVAFVVGSFAVIVPTPNGAGPWHFAVKTVLMLYGVNGNRGAMFALIVHTLQTLLTVLLGFWAMASLYMTKLRK